MPRSTSRSATADYHAMMLRVNRRYRERLHAGRELHLVEEHRQHRHGRRQPGLQRRRRGARGGNHSLYDFELNRRLGYSDIPHRLVGDVPLRAAVRQGQADRRVERGWSARSPAAGRSAARSIWQTGFPLADHRRRPTARPSRGPIASRASTSCCPRTSGAGTTARTPVTLPSGRVITPPARTYLKYNPDAFVGRVVTTPNGRIVADQFWYGNAAITYDEIRTDNRFNIDMSIRREFALPRRTALRVGRGRDEHPEPHAVQRRATTARLGGTVTTAEPGARPGRPGMGNSNSYGTRGMGTYNPRQIMLRATLRF